MAEKKTKAQLARENIALREAVTVGRQASNLLFNLEQMGKDLPDTITGPACDVRRQWDAAMEQYRKVREEA